MQRTRFLVTKWDDDHEVTDQPYWLDVSPINDTTFAIVDQNLANGDAYAFAKWDDDVQNLDAYDRDDPKAPFASAVAMIWGMSKHLRWRDVDMDLWLGHFGEYYFTSPSLDRLYEALAHVWFTDYRPDDI